VDSNEALNHLSCDGDVDARVAVLVEYAELVLGGAEGLRYSSADWDGLRTSILQLLADRWAQGRQEEGDGLGAATDDGETWTKMAYDKPPSDLARSPERRRRGLYVVPAPDAFPTPPEAQ
jgi:hypothetical protein